MIKELQKCDPNAICVAYDYDGSMHDAGSIKSVKPTARSKLGLTNSEHFDKMTRFVLLSVFDWR